MRQLFFVAMGGAVGALARWGLATVVKNWLGQSLPWGTAAVNVLGSLLFGLVWAATEGRVPIATTSRLLILTGFMGSFTTFSTYMFDTAALIHQDRWSAAAGQLVAQIALGLGGVFAGMWLGKGLAG